MYTVVVAIYNSDTLFLSTPGCAAIDNSRIGLLLWEMERASIICTVCKITKEKWCLVLWLMRSTIAMQDVAKILPGNTKNDRKWFLTPKVQHLVCGTRKVICVVIGILFKNSSGLPHSHFKWAFKCLAAVGITNFQQFSNQINTSAENPVK